MLIEKASRILVVDDSLIMGRIIVSLLRQLGYENVEVVAGPLAGMLKLHGGGIDLVICDYNMQPKSGPALLEEMRADPELCATPFIMVSAEARQDRVVAALHAGADGYLLKPFSAQMLKQRIDSVARGRQREAVLV